jgi:hypothetical protein
MENIIEKLDRINDDNIILDTWSLEEKNVRNLFNNVKIESFFV